MPTHGKQSSFTAQGLVLRRMLYTDLPLSREIFYALEKIHHATPEDWDWVTTEQAKKLAPFFEARYLMTDRVLNQWGVRQVVELAAGLSPRGIVWVAKNPTHTFVEVDLPDEVQLKWRVIEKLVEAGAIETPSQNFHILEGSVTDARIFEQLDTILSVQAEIGVVCEGLLRYLSFADKAILASHIHTLLEKFGGVWVTPDIEILTDDEQERIRRQNVGMRGVNIEGNLFADIPTAKKFFEDLGFAVLVAPLKEIAGELVSTRKCNLTLQESEAILKNHRVSFIMTVA